MIKCNVTINGTVSRAATVRTANGGGSFTCFSVKTVVPASSGAGKQVEISVSMDGTELMQEPLQAGTRVEMQGTLTFRKRNETLYLNFHADTVNCSPASDKDSIAGNIEFRGTVGKQVEEKTDKKGGKYLVFSAFSAEKDNEAFAFTWVRFIRFSTEREAFLVPKSKIQAKGELSLTAYLDRLNISCKVSEVSEWHRLSNANT